MKTLKMDQIENYLSSKDFQVAGIGNGEGYQLRKIFIKDGESFSNTWVQDLFPKAELVQNIEAITEDQDIDLLIIPAPEANDLDLLAKLVGTGKHVRVV